MAPRSTKMKNRLDIPRCGMPPLDCDTMRVLWRRPDPTLQQIAQALNIDRDRMKEIRQFIMGELLKPSDVEATVEDVLENAIEIQEGDILLMYQLRNTNEHGKTYWRDNITTMKIQSQGFQDILFPDTFDTPQAPRTCPNPKRPALWPYPERYEAYQTREPDELLYAEFEFRANRMMGSIKFDAKTMKKCTMLITKATWEQYLDQINLAPPPQGRHLSSLPPSTASPRRKQNTIRLFAV